MNAQTLTLAHDNAALSEPIRGPEGSPAGLLATIARAAADPGFDMGKLTGLMDFYERVRSLQARQAFDAAISAAKAEIPVINKNREVDFTSSKGRTNYQHEDFAEIARTVDPILAKHGLSYRFRPAQGEGGLITVTCILSHRDGHSEECSLSAGRDESGNKNNIQAVGSTGTYLQRYTLKMALGLAAGRDDDAKAADAGANISAAQRDELLALIEATGTDIAQFCGFLHVEALPDLPADQFARAKRALEAKAKKRQAKAGGVE